jgi:hypothetical protein
MRICTALLALCLLGYSLAGQVAKLVPGDKKINSKDGLTYLWVPPGTFHMGCSQPAKPDRPRSRRLCSTDPRDVFPTKSRFTRSR